MNVHPHSCAFAPKVRVHELFRGSVRAAHLHFLSTTLMEGTGASAAAASALRTALATAPPLLQPKPPFFGNDRRYAKASPLPCCAAAYGSRSAASRPAHVMRVGAAQCHVRLSAR